MIRVSELERRYGSKTVFESLNLEVRDGVTGLLGPNGAGKTTLLRCIATVLNADAGYVELNGIRTDTRGGMPASRRILGYLPQNPGFYQNFTTREILRYFAVLKLIRSADVNTEVGRVLELVDLVPQARIKVRNLSGGMRQRLGIAQALLGDPRIVVLDEPTVGLDPEQRIHFRSLVSLVGEGSTVLLSTHQTEDVAALCERVLVFSRGVIQFDGSPLELANVAAGVVWSASQRPSDGAYWKTADGSFRVIGRRPPGATPVSPTIEDGYLAVLRRADRSPQ